MTESARLMAVHAHPDDESSKGAATMAKYTAAGHRVRVVSCTGGERGDVLNPHLADDPAVMADLPAYRRREMALAAEALGIEHEWLGFVDSGLPEGDPLPPLPPGCFALTSDEDAVGALVRSIREFRPHVMTTYNENGGYPHPDHLRCHAISVAAYEAAADPEQFPEAGPAWSVSKLYYDVSFTRSRMVAIGEHMAARGLVSPFDEWLAERGDRPEREVTTRIECGQFFGRRDDALRAHATQIDPDGFFFAVPRDVEREAWPYEEFELARTRVGRPQGLETDLFDGIEIGDEQ